MKRTRAIWQSDAEMPCSKAEDTSSAASECFEYRGAFQTGIFRMGGVTLPVSAKAVRNVLFGSTLNILFAASVLLFGGCYSDDLSGRADAERRLSLASADGDVATVKSLLARGVDPEAGTGGIPNEPIYFAITSNQLKVAELLLNSGVDPNFDWGKGGGTLLTNAAQFGHNQMVRLLIKHGAKVNPDREGHSALYRAVIYGNEETVRLLMEHGAKLTKKDIQALEDLEAAGATSPLMFMVPRGD